MPDLVDSASATLSQSQQRAEIAGQNIANSTTPGYKRRISFAELVDTRTSGGAAGAQIGSAIDPAPGKLVQTGNPYDLAISGPGYFAVRRDDAIRYVRAGRFTRSAEGRLVDAFGGALQKADGNDLVVTDTDLKVLASGEVAADGAGRGSGAVGIFAPVDGTALPPIVGGFAEPPSGMSPAEEAEVVQGAYEASNVSTGDEMVALMQAIRQAESGQRVMIAYDDLMGRVLSTVGDSVR
ncbi:MAG: flagellar hook-basal body complex protein [Novosphingobium sp.]